MNFFDNRDTMYIPLSIDNAETNRSTYFFSNRKVVEMAIAIIPYFFLLVPLMQGGARWLSLAIMTGCYFFLYAYFLRFRIFEENRLRRMVNELDNNRISTVDSFWGINKITDTGVIHYVLDTRIGKELGIVVTFDRGSTVGVPEGSYERFRETKQAFLRELHLQGFDFRWYEIPERKSIPDSLIYYFNLMTVHPNEEFRKLLKLQIDINNMFVSESKRSYVDYVVIRNSNFRTLRRFHQIVSDVLERSLGMNSYFVNPHVCAKGEVEAFFEDYLVVDTIDSARIRRGVEVKPFEQFGAVYRIIRHDGVDVPIEFIERFDLENKSDTQSIEQTLQRAHDQQEAKERNWLARKQKALDILRVSRLKDRISHDEYADKKSEVEAKFEAERQAQPTPKKSKPKPKPKPVSTPMNEGPEIVQVDDEVVVNMQQKMRDRIRALQEAQQAQTVELSLEERMAQLNTAQVDNQVGAKTDTDSSSSSSSSDE